MYYLNWENTVGEISGLGWFVIGVLGVTFCLMVEGMWINYMRYKMAKLEKEREECSQ